MADQQESWNTITLEGPYQNSFSIYAAYGHFWLPIAAWCEVLRVPYFLREEFPRIAPSFANVMAKKTQTSQETWLISIKHVDYCRLQVIGTCLDSWERKFDELDNSRILHMGKNYRDAGLAFKPHLDGIKLWLLSLAERETDMLLKEAVDNAQSSLAPITTDQLDAISNKLTADIDRVRQENQALSEAIDAIRRAQSKRKNAPQWVWDLHTDYLGERFGGRCPINPKIQIVTSDGIGQHDLFGQFQARYILVPGVANLDHFFSNQLARASTTWIISIEAHKEYTANRMKRAINKQPFEIYQYGLKHWAEQTGRKYD
jgi:hypothetical protein